MLPCHITVNHYSPPPPFPAAPYPGGNTTHFRHDLLDSKGDWWITLEVRRGLIKKETRVAVKRWGIFGAAAREIFAHLIWLWLVFGDDVRNLIDGVHYISCIAWRVNSWPGGLYVCLLFGHCELHSFFERATETNSHYPNAELAELSNSQTRWASFTNIQKHY